jgi:hypothetical protein
MGKSSLSPVMQQRIAVLVPIIALVLSLFVVYPAWGRYGDKRAAITKKQGELTTLINTPLPPDTTATPTADDLPTEPPQIYGEITSVARAAQCDIVGYDLSTKTGSAEADKESPVKALRGKVEIEASYPQIRAFLFELARAQRLFVVTDMVITTNRSTNPQAPAASSNGPLHATIEIERYVAPPVTAAANPAS